MIDYYLLLDHLMKMEHHHPSHYNKILLLNKYCRLLGKRKKSVKKRKEKKNMKDIFIFSLVGENTYTVNISKNIEKENIYIRDIFNLPGKSLT